MKGATILVCDDHKEILDVTKEILQLNDYTVIGTRSCVDIEAVVLTEKPHLILIDSRMPEMSGEEATKLLKNNPATKHIPVLIFSANHKGEHAALEAGADGFIKKPFDIDVFLKTVEEQLFRVSN